MRLLCDLTHVCVLTVLSSIFLSVSEFLLSALETETCVIVSILECTTLVGPTMFIPSLVQLLASGGVAKDQHNHSEVPESSLFTESQGLL